MARFTWERKKKGLVHTVCACVKKSQISVTLGHMARTFLDIFVIINGRGKL